MSKGEQMVNDWLERNKITFSREHKFDDCLNPRTNRRLSFDFYIPQQKVVVEVDGVQHWKQIKEWGESENALKGRQYRDKVKDEYCEKKGLLMIRIPFSHFSVLERTLKAYLLQPPTVDK